MATTEVIETIETADLSDWFPDIKPGADWKWTLEVQDDNGDVQDTTGWDCACKVKNKANGETKASLTVGSGITHTTGQGQFDFAITDTQTAALDCNQVEFDVLLTDDTGEKTIPVKATVDVAEVITP